MCMQISSKEIGKCACKKESKELYREVCKKVARI